MACAAIWSRDVRTLTSASLASRSALRAAFSYAALAWSARARAAAVSSAPRENAESGNENPADSAYTVVPGEKSDDGSFPWLPYDPVTEIVGRFDAIVAPIRAVAAANARSACCTSGRRASSDALSVSGTRSALTAAASEPRRSIIPGAWPSSTLRLCSVSAVCRSTCAIVTAGAAT